MFSRLEGTLPLPWPSPLSGLAPSVFSERLGYTISRCVSSKHLHKFHSPVKGVAQFPFSCGLFPDSFVSPLLAFALQHQLSILFPLLIVVYPYQSSQPSILSGDS